MPEWGSNELTTDATPWWRPLLPRPPLWAFDPKTGDHEPSQPPLPNSRSFAEHGDRHAELQPSPIPEGHDRQRTRSDYPALAYHVQDGGSQDGTVELLATEIFGIPYRIYVRSRF